MKPTPRPAARVLVVDARDRLLLFEGIVPGTAGPRLWVAPGGALRPGETFEEAARRELQEETGITGVALSPCVWRRRHTFEMSGRLWAGDERYFLARVGDAEVRTGGFEAHEQECIFRHRWWTADEIAASTEIFVPRRLGALLPPLLRGELPAEPVDTGI